MGKVRSKSIRFTKKADSIIINHMKEPPIFYAKIKKEIPEYTTKQIRQRWTNQLDPKLCHDPLDEYDEILIIKLVKKNRKPNGTICWTTLIPEVEAKTGKKRSENKLKNFWYSRRGQVLSKNYIFPQDDDVLLSQDGDASGGARDDDNVLPSRDDNGVLSRLDILCQEALKYDFLQ
ncbi:uncharacterized protein OCT59_003509 [Rhizophagus irregularis]|uniref:HTH myb-type domain-containing protein n=2 Tax=Rhizophagus irregularis TaxID=588596 RepID=A0A015M263_RHIIW|nr:hypothetical protein GLOIN_2v1782447 [Rhizophagus irregularis DAOM 181602=DAOM 197198]EXX60933.1 hypothetical protein RirG_175470 [Rhizophagus irregularis DAOM 197198w]UZO11957.1 hypothetical protein OCT59_003509 [Rhizophagus irregularis]POG64823.1 hypothetical protein GLOIN_2v1782447 [Rhizophagus irregularis DAOM 181602=DAOM 197198]CAG8656187.1 10329_t:CDS:2 [Rhizophagus irregularis]GBC37484.1 hypothetical protein GLOIN_2v1782447 [Rhizophagus irregularis DAOM 181602=DAOM 197198]|eukprot:XP_025171689.1 hypothetical protein GLOIN_2v1782447 [Rhizophagus irregularis DAOM 181602=DAOM 197198]